MNKYQNLSVPFSVPIPGGMSPGKMVVVQGNVPSMSQRFAVNLLTRSGDIALHVCPRFKENRVVRNNVLNMNWGPEESHGSMPVFPGQSFEIIILCESYSFKVSFNGRHFCDFSHRLPFNSISSLAVDGEVSVQKVEFKEPNGYGNNNNDFGDALPYGFEPDPPSKQRSGGLYPTIDSYPYPPNSRRSPSPSAPSSGGFKLPTPNAPQYPIPNAPLYPSPNVPQYPSPTTPQYPNPNGPGYSSSGGSYPQNPSSYPTQPSYPSIPHQGPYPQMPSSNTGGGNGSSSHGSKHGFLDQAGAALAGVLGPAILAGGMSRHSTGHGKPNLLDEAGRALAGVIGGAGLAGAGRNERGTQPRSPTSHSPFLDQAGSALAGILGGAGLSGAATRSLRGFTPPPSRRQTQPGNILDQAGSALAGILGGGGLSGTTGTSLRGVTPPPPSRHAQPGNILDQAGSALAGILGGGGLTGAGSSHRGGLPLSPARSPQSRLLDEAGSALADLLGGGGLSGNRNTHRRGTLGTAVAGAALTGHLNPIKATKKQLKAHKKALKYGLPIAGAGLGAYALHKGLKKGFRRSSSSSSCSSSD